MKLKAAVLIGAFLTLFGNAVLASWTPSVKTSWQLQLTGQVDQSLNVDMYDIDLFDNDASVINALRTAGKKVVCYFSAGSWEDWRPDAILFPESAQGRSNGWAGEKWLDIRDATVRELMKGRIQLAKDKGCDGVDPDNVDGYSNRTGFPLTSDDQLAYNRFIAAAAHKPDLNGRTLLVGLKNDVEQVEALVLDFDWAMNEQCFEYNECNALIPFITHNKPVFNIEYKLQTSKFCPKANAMNFNSLRKKLNLGAYREAC